MFIILLIFLVDHFTEYKPEINQYELSVYFSVFLIGILGILVELGIFFLFSSS